VDHVFRTKTGLCTITDDRIVLTRGGVRGAVAEVTVGRSIWRPLITYGVLGAALLAFGVTRLAVREYLPGVVFCGFGGVFLCSVITSRNNSATPVILRSTIRGIVARPPRPPIVRGHFIVTFDEGGKERRRFILLPGTGSGGREEYAKAVQVMTAAGLLPPS